MSEYKRQIESIFRRFKVVINSKLTFIGSVVSILSYIGWDVCIKPQFDPKKDTINAFIVNSNLIQKNQKDTVFVIQPSNPNQGKGLHNENAENRSDVAKKSKENTEIPIPANYINPIPKSEITILILDENNKPINSISSQIASLYMKGGHSASINLFNAAFLKSAYLDELINGNSKIIKEFSLSSYADYVVIGRYSAKYEKGGTFFKLICQANIDISVISCSLKQLRSFSVSGRNGADDKEHAKTGAMEKIIKKYEANYLDL
jgi:hypothetical protein